MILFIADLYHCVSHKIIFKPF